MSTASFDVKTDSGFDGLSIFVQAFQRALTADVLNDGNPDLPIKYDVKAKTAEFLLASFDFSHFYSFELHGNFDAKKRTGEIRQIDLVVDSAVVAEVKNPDLDLKELVAMKYPSIGLIERMFGYNEKMIVNGGRGDDFLLANSGEVHGAKGNDTLFGQGKALLDGGSGIDTVSYSVSLFGKNEKSGVTASLADSTVNTGLAKGDKYNSIENLTGTNQNDTLYGDKGANVLTGHMGNDVLDGGAKADVLDGGDGVDLASYQSSKAGVTVIMSNMSFSTGDAKDDSFVGIEGVIGSRANDTLVGDASNNVLKGHDGDDFIDGGIGEDELWGDSEKFGVDGADTFAINGFGQGLKKIMDFDAFDHIQIKLAGFGISPDYELIEDMTYVAEANAAAKSGHWTFLFDTATNELKFDEDGNGGRAAIVLATVKFDQQQFLDINDFVLV